MVKTFFTVKGEFSKLKVGQIFPKKLKYTAGKYLVL